ncbi:MAG: ergothioneine biosynthesis protein EgtC [Gammaproteobacteria bacterium]|nr:MAG: ergothioneine biosynthesis protein EgtC [Gammaproteobacteria bacterium]
MCRLAAYLGEPVEAAALLLRPEHSLYRQSWQPRELRYACVNADGWGMGWFDAAGHPRHYRSAAPIWADPNLRDLSEALVAPLWLGFVRSATEGFGNAIENVQPFHDGTCLFLHNGFVGDFARSLRRPLTQALDDEHLALLRGSTDSEHLFALASQLLAELGDPVEALAALAEWVAARLDRGVALLNLVLARPGEVVALRHAIRDQAPSLYWLEEGMGLAPGARMLASEPLQADAPWQAVPASHILRLVPDKPPEILAL